MHKNLTSIVLTLAVLFYGSLSSGIDHIQGGPIANVRYEFYEIQGRDFSELINRISSYGLYDERTGRRIAASTQWHIIWKYNFSFKYYIKNHLVYVDIDMSGVDLDLLITVVLPRLSGGTNLSRTEMIKWNQYIKKLIEHENHHVNLILSNFDRKSLLKEINKIEQIIFKQVEGPVEEKKIREMIISRIKEIAKRRIQKIRNANMRFDNASESWFTVNNGKDRYTTDMIHREP